MWQTLKPSLTKGTTPNVAAGGADTVCHPGVRVVVTQCPQAFKFYLIPHISSRHEENALRCDNGPLDFLGFFLGLENEREITEAEIFTFLSLPMEGILLTQRLNLHVDKENKI